jgi:hypothetical protein
MQVRAMRAGTTVATCACTTAGRRFLGGSARPIANRPQVDNLPHGQTATGIGTGIAGSALRISRQRRRRASFFFRNLP